MWFGRVAVVRAGAIFRHGELLERPVDIAAAESVCHQTITAQSELAQNTRSTVRQLPPSMEQVPR
jgi:hypothetical protein